ncbi:hypothetical protein F6X42_26510 [Paraburkholderia sp. WC7.3b]|uniref:Uncharacterized protein n=1 Tax=Paraburkholderia podalyriae TaxID=1938811 RepID=A0ABR7PUQ2_9BURK|nr:hypothetical protein [Paraburkholderia podalyriae]
MLRSRHDRLSQCDVMKQRTHPGTPILFCAIKENPRGKNCCMCERGFKALRGKGCGRMAASGG